MTKEAILESFKNDTAKTDTYYWVQGDEYTEPMALLYNINKQWKVEMSGQLTFISSGKLRLIFGKLCVLREIDFKNDMIDSLPQKCQGLILHPYMILSDSKKQRVLYRNDYVINIGMGVIPQNIFPNEGSYIQYKE